MLMKRVHGPVALVEICLSRPSFGFGALTVSVSVAVLLPPTIAADTAPLVFAYVPGVADVTGTVIVQEAPAPTVPPVSDRLLPPADAVTAAPQVLATAGVNGLALTTPAGYVSLNCSDASASSWFGLVTVNVNSDVA